LIPLICLHPLAVTGSHSHFPGFLESAKARGKVLGAKFGIVSTDVSCFSIGPTVWCIWKTDSINAWPGRILRYLKLPKLRQFQESIWMRSIRPEGRWLVTSCNIRNNYWIPIPTSQHWTLNS
jgi:hypothetical protein